MSGHEERKHKKYSPSSMERHELCPGSGKLLERVPARKDSVYSVEGMKAHTVLQDALMNRVRNAREAHSDYSSLCMETFNDDFFTSIQVCLDYVYELLNANPDAEMWVEEFVDPPSEAAPGETGGFCDICIWIPSVRTLIVIDYKHGAGVTKAAVGNNQPMQYAAGFLYGEPAFVDPAQVDRVCVAIVQPRAYHADGEIREHWVTPYEVYEYLDKMDNIIRAAQAPDAPLVPGETQCKFCAANTTCPAREARALAAVSTQFRTVHDIKAPDMPNIGALTPAELSFRGQLVPILKQWCNDIMKAIDEAQTTGIHIPGFKLVETEARRSWYGNADEIAVKLAALADKPVDTFYRPRELITITDAEALVKAAFRARAPRGGKNKASEEAGRATAYLTLRQSSGALKSVPEDDPAPAVRPKSNAFAQIAGVLPIIEQTGE